jgi:hypothetical protein
MTCTASSISITEMKAAPAGGARSISLMAITLTWTSGGYRVCRLAMNTPLYTKVADFLGAIGGGKLRRQLSETPLAT